MAVTSTVLDAALCLLLVSGAVVVVTEATPATHERGTAADATVETLSTATTTVAFEREGRSVRRHATLSGHLAAATLARVELDGRRVTGGRGAYVTAVREAVRAATGSRTQVVAVWRPYPNAPLSATLTVGPAPPPNAAVHAETVRVASGISPVRRTETLDSDAFGRRVADTVVAGLFPADELGYALDDPTVAPLVRERYARAGGALGVDAGRPTSDDVRDLNDRFADELGDRLGTHVAETGSETPRTTTETVTVTVRTWS